MIKGIKNADNRNRTCTPKDQILSLARLPVPPHPHILLCPLPGRRILLQRTHTKLSSVFCKKSITFCGLFKNTRCISKQDFKVFTLVRHSRTSIFSTKTFFQHFLSFVRQKKHKNNVATSKLLLFFGFYPCIMGTFAVLLCGRLPRAWHLLP